MVGAKTKIFDERLGEKTPAQTPFPPLLNHTLVLLLLLRHTFLVVLLLHSYALDKGLATPPYDAATSGSNSFFNVSRTSASLALSRPLPLRSSTLRTAHTQLATNAMPAKMAMSDWYLKDG